MGKQLKDMTNAELGDALARARKRGTQLMAAIAEAGETPELEAQLAAAGEAYAAAWHELTSRRSE